MKLICPISSIEYHTSTGYGSGTQIHPALAQPLKYSIGNLPSYLSGRVSAKDDVYLYHLSWLVHMPSIEFRYPLNREKAEPKLAACFEYMIKVITKAQQHIHAPYPTIVIDKTTNTLDQLWHWLEAINEVTHELAIASEERIYSTKLLRIESSLDRILKSSFSRSKPRAAKVISEWASIAAAFPRNLTTWPDGKTVTPLADYWKTIIQYSFAETTNNLLSLNVSLADMDELIEECEDHIPHGSIYAAILMKSLRSARSVIQEMIYHPNRIKLDDIYTTASAVPQFPRPERKNYKNQLEFVRALAKWQREVLDTRYTTMEL